MPTKQRLHRGAGDADRDKLGVGVSVDDCVAVCVDVCVSVGDSEPVGVGVIVAVLDCVGVRDGDGASRKPEKHSKYPAGHIAVPAACCTHAAEAVLVPTGMHGPAVPGVQAGHVHCAAPGGHVDNVASEYCQQTPNAF